MLISIYAEYIRAFEKVNVCLTLQKPLRGLGINIAKPNHLQITYCSIDKNKEDFKTQIIANIHLIDLEVMPVTCSNLKFDLHANTLELCLKAYKKDPEKLEQSFDAMKIAQGMLKESSQLKCYICKVGLLNTRSINQALDLPPLPLLGSHKDDLFCHASNTNGNDFDWRPPPPTTALTNGTDIITNSLLYNKQLIKQGIHDLICCTRCRNIIGRRFQVNDENVYCFNTSRLLAEVEEKDIDGDFIQNIDVPIIMTRHSYFSLMVKKLIEEHSFRVIVSGCTSKSSQEFMLLWLFDKTSNIYSSNLDIDVDSLIGAAESGESIQSEDCSLAAETSHSLLYAICKEDNKQVLSDWKHDMSVQHVDLPEDECHELARLLIRSTSKLPKLQRMANSFYRGEIPVA